MWYINDDKAVPPLPKEVPLVLEPGCWAVQLDPFFSDDWDADLAEHPTLRGWAVQYVGTLRAEPVNHRNGRKYKKSNWMRASGDLYVQRQVWTEKESAAPSFFRIGEVPIFPLRDYAFYFTIRAVAFEAAKPVLTIASFRFNRDGTTWNSETLLTGKPAPVANLEPWGSIPPGQYLCWDLFNDRRSRIGKLRLVRIAQHLREANIEIAAANQLKPPLMSGRGDTIPGVFQKVGWKVKVRPTLAVQGPSDIWRERDLHSKMVELRSKANLDSEWLYHVLVVPRFQDRREHGFGKMYDMGTLDSNLVPREGIVIALDARFPAEARFGSAGGRMLREVRPAAFRVLIHELGHAMGLLHRFRGAYFLQALIHIASRGARGDSFPGNIEFRFDPEDELRLRHYPDFWVRPGGAPFEHNISVLPFPETDAITEVGRQFELLVKPLRRVVPLGAPVKLQLRLKNISPQTLPSPRLLSLSAGSVAGRVIGPGGTSHPFSAVAPLDSVQIDELAPDQAIFHAETLLRGPRGSLFPLPGLYTIEINVKWVGPSGIAQISSQCDIKVTFPRNRHHERVALELLRARELSLLLIFRTALQAEGETAKKEIGKAIRVLRRSLRVRELRIILGPVEARRIADGDLKKASKLISRESLMTTSEIEHFLNAVAGAKKKARQHWRIRRMVKICRSQAWRAFCKGLAPRTLYEKAEELLKCL